jgi:hypothetical protein
VSIIANITYDCITLPFESFQPDQFNRIDMSEGRKAQHLINIQAFVVSFPLFLYIFTPYFVMALEKDGKIGWTDHVRNEEVLLRDKEQRNILH